MSCGSNIDGRDITCTDIKESSVSLKKSYTSCKQGDSCYFVDMYDVVSRDNCILAFQCSSSFRTDSDIDEFREEAQKLVNDFRSCSECAMASCAGTSGYEAFCNIEKGLCDMRPIMVIQ